MARRITSYECIPAEETGIFRKIVLRLLAVFILTVTLILVRFPGGAKGYLYIAFREIVKLNTMVKTHHWESMNNEYVSVRYKPGDEENARLLLDTTNLFLGPVTNSFDYDIKNKIPVILYPSREELNASFGWPASERAMGVYWGGVIRVLSPDEWIDYDNWQEKKLVFENCGPMAHELTHLVVDYKARGNYPRWFTEGLAQYQEYQLTGFRFNDASGNLDQQLYPLNEMDKNFDSLPNQSLAYRQSLSVIEYIVKVYGEGKLHKIINNLAKGWSTDRAFVNSLGVNLHDLEKDWHHWLVQNKESS